MIDQVYQSDFEVFQNVMLLLNIQVCVAAQHQFIDVPTIFYWFIIFIVTAVNLTALFRHAVKCVLPRAVLC